MQPRAVIADTDEASIEQILSALRERVGDKNYRVWFEDKERLRIDGDLLAVEVNSPFELNWMQRQFGNDLELVARDALGPSGRVEFLVHAAAPASPAEPAKPQPSARDVRQQPATIPLQRHAENSEVVASRPVDAPPPRRPMNRPAPTPSRSFVDFVVGPENELAYTAARRAAESADGASFGPYYIYGGIGIGKTHLLEAMTVALRRTSSGQNVLRMTAETFANYFTKALRDRSLPAFRHKMRAVDALLIDDVDFLDGKKVIQEEFLHTVKQLEERGKLMVFTADRHPRLLLKTREDLTSRLGSGMICRMENPDEQTRRKIVEFKARRLGLDAPDEVLDYLAKKFSRTVRELEGALNCLSHFAQMSGRRLTLSSSRQVLADLERDCIRLIHLSDIEKCVCRFFGLQPADLKSGVKKQAVSHPRMLAMFLARKLTQSSYSAIGSYFGGRRHNTVVSAERTVQKWIDDQQPLRIASREWTMSDILGTLERELLAV